ncbi:MAG: ester cyclase, partial [Albidovulum sp.]|nr:ester cyclase [Albidovulum sp.]
MDTDTHEFNKAVLRPLRLALYHGNVKEAAIAVETIFDENAQIHLTYPFETLCGPDSLCREVLASLAKSIPDLERRDTIVIGGTASNGSRWVGCCGYYTGSFKHPWLDIPPTGHQASMRFHEFFRFESGKVVEMQALWDIPELMIQAGAWPMSPSLGREWHVPGPATQDGLRPRRGEGEA